MWLWGVVAGALAGAPEVRPVVQPATVVDAWRAEARAGGRKGEAAEIACRNLVEQVLLCFVQGQDLQPVTQADLKAWGENLAAVEARARDTALAGLTATRPAPQTVEGMTGRYWLSAEADGLDAAALLYPDRLAAIVGAEPVVAMPQVGVLLMWAPGDAEFDKVMAVGVRRMYDAAEMPISRRIYRWNGQSWVVWGEAVESLAPRR